jgi:hypothetical protein
MRGSAAAHLLGMRVRIPPGHGCLSLVVIVCCQVKVSASKGTLPSLVCLSVIVEPLQLGGHKNTHTRTCHLQYQHGSCSNV